MTSDCELPFLCTRAQKLISKVISAAWPFNSLPPAHPAVRSLHPSQFYIKLQRPCYISASFPSLNATLQLCHHLWHTYIPDSVCLPHMNVLCVHAAGVLSFCTGFNLLWPLTCQMFTVDLSISRERITTRGVWKLLVVEVHYKCNITFTWWPLY